MCIIRFVTYWFKGLLTIVNIAIVIFTIQIGFLMKIIKTKLFSKWAIKNNIKDKSLFNAGLEIASDNYEANYGGGVIKKRVANKGRGKSGSVRTIVAFKKGNDCFFVYGFEKNTKSNISQNEEKAIKLVAKTLFTYTDNELSQLIDDGALIEVSDEE